MPFDIPDSWTWIRLKDLISIQTGASFKKEQSTNESKDNYIRVLRGGNILPFRYLLKQDDLYIPSKLVSENILLRKNDLITPAVTSLENIGKIAVIDKDLNSVTTGGFVYIFRPYINNTTLSLVISDFISSSLYQSLMKKITKKSGQAFYNMNKEKLLQLYYPLAPLTEQVRIVDKIGFIEPLLEKYDLVEKKLSALEAEFPEKLKKSILQYAIEGKLVKQDPNDEPASVLLERIKSEKERLIKEGKIKRDKNESYIYQGDDKNYYENLPLGWSICTLNNLAIYKKGPFGSSLIKGMFVPATTPNRIKVYEQKNAIQHDYSLGNYYITNEKYNEMISFTVNPLDFIVSCAGTIGEIYKLPKTAPIGIINQALMKVTLINEEISDYFEILFYDTLHKLSEKSKGTAIKNIPPFDILKPAIIKLPPIQEQKRILKNLKIISNLLGY